MLDWFRALLPKEERFFGLFEQHAALVVAGAESLRAALEGGLDLPQHLQAVVERENEADAVTREVLKLTVPWSVAWVSPENTSSPGR